jgi:hypothetical protein
LQLPVRRGRRFIFSGSDVTIDFNTTTLLVGAAGFLLALLYAQHKDDKFDLRNVLVDSTTDKVSLVKLGQFVALCVSTWGFVVLVQKDKLTEWYFAGYILSWVGANLGNKWITGKQGAT